MKTGKIFLTSVSIALLMAAMVLLGSCKKGSGEVTPDVAALLKSGTWKVKTVTVDGSDKLSLFTGLTLTFSTSSLSTINGEPVWPGSGTWALNSDGTIITRGDGLTVTIDNISETSLGLSLVWGKNTLGGRIGSVKGNHVFTFGK